MKTNPLQKILIVIPILTIPIIALVFWLMDGGKGMAASGKMRSGFNTHLPDASAKRDSGSDKMSFYQAAQNDSSKRAEQIKNDPYRRDSVKVPVGFSEPLPTTHSYGSYREPVYHSSVNEKSAPVVAKAIDPDLEAINGMLEKLSDLKNPKPASGKGLGKQLTLSVMESEETQDDFFGQRKKDRASKFLTDQVSSKYGMTAAISSAQVLQSGSVVKLELSSAITIGDVVLGIGTPLYGVSEVAGERLLIFINSIRYSNQVLPVQLSVYDYDGMEGIYVPGSLSRNVFKESADGAIQSTGINAFDGSLKTQVVGAGIGAAKSMLSKKVKVVRVQVEAGYQVLLRDTKSKLQP